MEDLQRSQLGGVSVVVPVYHSTTTLPELLSRVRAVLVDRPYEVIFVDDGSGPATRVTLADLAQEPGVVVLRLGRNFGQHAALLAGIRQASHPLTVTIDDDLQHPPEMMTRLLDALQNEAADVVYGWSPAAVRSWWRRAGSATVRRIVATALDVPSAEKMGAFRAFRTQLRDGFDGPLGPAVSIDALLGWSTTNFSFVEVEHHERLEGTSGYTFRKLFRFAIDTFTGYSVLPLRMVSYLGLAASLLGFGLLLYVLIGFLLRGSPVAGFPFLASMIAIFSGLQMLSLGIIGEYLGRMHLRIQRRPTYVIAQRWPADDLPT